MNTYSWALYFIPIYGNIYFLFFQCGDRQVAALKELTTTLSDNELYAV